MNYFISYLGNRQASKDSDQRNCVADFHTIQPGVVGGRGRAEPVL